jgi:hypothetical protein
VLDRTGVRDRFIEAVRAARARSIEMGEELGKP